MTLSHFFFTPHVTTGTIDGVERNSRRRSRGARRRRIAMSNRIDAIEDDVGYLSLVLASLIETVEEKGVITRDELRAVVARFDQIDGVEDGKLDVNYLREPPEGNETDGD